VLGQNGDVSHLEEKSAVANDPAHAHDPPAALHAHAEQRVGQPDLGRTRVALDQACRDPDPVVVLDRGYSLDEPVGAHPTEYSRSGTP